MNNNDDLKNKIELAGLKGHTGMEAIAKYAPLMKNAAMLKKLERVLDMKATLAEDSHPFPSPNDEDVAEGEIKFGNILRMDCSLGGRVGNSLNNFSQGTFVVGTTGSGKTYFLGYLCKQLLDHLKVLIFDRDAQFPKLLANEIATGKITPVHYRDLRINLLQPVKGEAPMEAVNRIASTLRNSMGLGDPSQNILVKQIKKLYQEHGILEGGKDYPTLIELYEALSKMTYLQAKEREYWQVLWNRVDHLVNQLADVYDCRQGYPIEDFLGNSLIVDLMGFADSLMRFVIEHLVSSIIAYRERLGITEIRNILVVDESHRLLTGQWHLTWNQSEPLLHSAPRFMRRMGFGLILADQVPSQIPSSVMANMGTRIVLRLINGPCIRSVADSMSLSPEKRAVIPELTDRNVILHYQKHEKPFLIRIPDLDFQSNISKEEMNCRTSALLQRFKWVPRRVAENSDNQTGYVIPGSPRRRPPDAASPPKGELDYLESIARNPFVPVTERDRKLGLTTYKGNKLRKDFCERGLITIHHVDTGKKGGITLVEITSKGWALLERYKVNVRKPAGKGGLIHQFWQDQLRKWFLGNYPGCKAVIEQMVEGKAVDVGVEIEGRKVAVEIMIKGQEKELVNIVKDLEVGFDEVVIVCEDKEKGRSLEGKIGETLGEKYSRVVSIGQLKEFYLEGAKESGQYA